MPSPDWPPGISTRNFDGSDEDLEGWTRVFNRSWTEQDHGVLATVDHMRRHLAGGTFDPAGMFFAIEDGEPVGFVRAAPHPSRAEIAVIGVAPEWRGRGLGRALLRHGGRWLAERGFERIALNVDGKNERALRLYRQEGFAVERTRQAWSRML